MKAMAGEKHRTHLILTDVEKLDSHHSNFAFSVKALLDQGIPVEKIPAEILRIFGVTINASAIEHYRKKRWVPEKEVVALKMATTKAAIEAFGGDTGFDAVILAKLWELMDKMTIPQLLAARTLFVRVRAQNLKEQEFLYRTGQLQPCQEAEGEDADPHAQQKKVLQRIKEIFGLASGQELPRPVRQLPPADGNAEACVVRNDES